MLTLLRSKMLASSFRVGLILILATIIFLMGKRITVLSQDNNRLENNIATFKQNITEFKSVDGKTVYQNEAMELRIKELSLLYPQLLEEVRNLKVKPSRLKSISENGIANHTTIKSILTDSTGKDSISYKYFNYNDGWYNVTGFAALDTQHLNITSVDTLVQIVYKGDRERPWLWIFSRRKLMQRVSLKNPSARINYTQYIKLQKRKGLKE